MTTQTFKRRHDQFVTAALFEGGRTAAMELCKWMGSGSSYIPQTHTDPREYVQIPTPFGPRDITAGNWIVRSGDGTFLPYKDGPFGVEFTLVEDEDARLIQHARVELAKFPNEDAAFIESIMNTIKAFSEYKGHSGGSSSVAIKMVTMLLNGFNLLPLTDDPEEWEYRPGADYGIDNNYWQSTRNSAALTQDETLKTYFLVTDKKNVDGTLIIYNTEAKDFVPEITEEDLKNDEELWAEKFKAPYCTVPGHPEGRINLEDGTFYCAGCETSHEAVINKDWNENGPALS